jgi:pimeloyl-ACP methyl ester carboxylesterase
VQPLLFGRREAPLYGVYHPPGETRRDVGVVLCYPFGQEYMRSHRAFRQLAKLLTRAGFHVLRFDFSGTGDSSGEMDSVEADDWLRDIGDAVDELRETAAISRVSLVGFRLGALFAAAHAAEQRDIEQLVVWDPVLSGAHYVEEWRREIALDMATTHAPAFGNAERPDGTLHFNGFALSPRFRATMTSLDLRQAAPPDETATFHVATVEDEACLALREAWRAHPGYRYQFAPAAHDWNLVDTFGGILLPQAAIQAIVGWLDTRERP